MTSPRLAIRPSTEGIVDMPIRCIAHVRASLEWRGVRPGLSQGEGWVHGADRARTGEGPDTCGVRALAPRCLSRASLLSDHSPHGAAATCLGVDHDVPDALNAPTRNDQICRVMVGEVNVVTLAPTEPDPATVVKLSALHWIV